MAERRMFHTSVVESDLFLDMPVGAQALYFHLGMHADDDGFVNGPRQITRMIGTSVKYLELLVEKGFLLEAEGVVILRHWLQANVLKKDRLRPLQYPMVAQRIYIEHNALYTMRREEGCISLFDSRNTYIESNKNKMRSRKTKNDSNNLEIGSKMESKVREGKVREDNVREDNISEDKIKEDKLREDTAADAAVSGAAATAAHRYPEFMQGNLGKGVVLLSQEQIEDLLERMGLDGFDFYVDKLSSFIVEKGAKVKNHYATILKWWQEDKGCFQ